jgi:hypothetical protein
LMGHALMVQLLTSLCVLLCVLHCESNDDYAAFLSLMLGSRYQ